MDAPFLNRSRKGGRKNGVADFWGRCAPEPNTGCWLWLGVCDRDGYGRFNFGGEKVRAPRFAWSLANAAEIPDGLVVMHRCDTPLCVNPDHLVLGTHADNIADRDRKGRKAMGAAVAQPGERSPSHKLTAADVEAIRASRLSQYKLGKMYGVDPSTIHNARSGKTWKTLR